MNQRCIALLSVFAVIIVIETVAAVFGWGRRRGIARPLMGLLVFQVALPAILFVLGLVFPPPPSGDAMNLGIFNAALLFVVPFIEILLLGIGLDMATWIFVALAKGQTQQEPQLPLGGAGKPAPQE